MHFYFGEGEKERGIHLDPSGCHSDIDTQLRIVLLVSKSAGFFWLVGF